MRLERKLQELFARSTGEIATYYTDYQGSFSVGLADTFEELESSDETDESGSSRNAEDEVRV